MKQAIKVWSYKKGRKVTVVLSPGDEWYDAKEHQYYDGSYDCNWQRITHEGSFLRLVGAQSRGDCQGSDGEGWEVIANTGKLNPSWEETKKGAW